MKWRISIWAAGLLSALTFSCNSIPCTPIHPMQLRWGAMELRCEYQNNPIGIDTSAPRFSWQLFSEDRNAIQTAYQILVFGSQEALQQGKADVWDSGKVPSRQTSQIAYAGKPLVARQRYYWIVQVWDKNDHPSAMFSADHFWEMGLLDADDWKARFVQTDPLTIRPMEILAADFHTLDGKVHKDVTEFLRGEIKDGRLQVDVKPSGLGGDPAPGEHKALTIRYTVDGREMEVTSPEARTLRLPPTPVRVLGKDVDIQQPIRRARLYVTALGLYHGTVNGRRVKDNYLAPGWTDYRQRVQYQTYDLTRDIHVGHNQLDFALAGGWYSGYIGNGKWHYYGDAPSLMAQLEVQLADGSTQIIATDDTWSSRRGPILASDNMYGEWCDATTLTEQPPDRVVFTSSGIPPHVVAQSTAPVTLDRTLKAVSCIEVPKGSGRWIYDLGQNMVGTAAIHLQQPVGTKLTLRYGEMLDKDGSLYVDNLRGAVATDTYICKGGPGGDRWAAAFAYHGFRYVELSGVSQPPPADAVVGLVYCSYSSIFDAGTFSCSSFPLRKLQSNIQWGQRGNFVSVPTDCPQRDERQGWTGDAEAFIQTATFNANLAAFYDNWMRDLDYGQNKEGGFPNVAPDVLGEYGSPGWADAGVICPFIVYKMYGDRVELAEHYPAMKRWVDECRQHSTDLIRDKDRGSDFGDWLNDHAPTPKDLIGTAFFAHAADLVAQSANVLGNKEDAGVYRALYEQSRSAFDRKYLKQDDTLRDDTQTACALAIDFDLLATDEQRTAVGNQLVKNLRERGTRLSTGFLGVGHLLPALTRTGHGDVAYELLMQDQYPSWLFSVKQGATTIWERWDGWTPDKGFQEISMNSFNHYALGSCGQWFYQAIAGIDQSDASAGFQQIRIHPLLPPLGKEGQPLLTHAEATYSSIHGPIRSAWSIDRANQMTLKVTIPPNCDAAVELPTVIDEKITESNQPLGRQAGIMKLTSVSNGVTALTVGSGDYEFHFPVTLKASAPD